MCPVGLPMLNPMVAGKSDEDCSDDDAVLFGVRVGFVSMLVQVLWLFVRCVGFGAVS